VAVVDLTGMIKYLGVEASEPTSPLDLKLPLSMETVLLSRSV